MVFEGFLPIGRGFPRGGKNGDHPANEYAFFQKLFHPWFPEDDAQGFSSIPRLPPVTQKIL
jgi:hypothetical protein